MATHLQGARLSVGEWDEIIREKEYDLRCAEGEERITDQECNVARADEKRHKAILKQIELQDSHRERRRTDAAERTDASDLYTKQRKRVREKEEETEMAVQNHIVAQATTKFQEEVLWLFKIKRHHTEEGHINMRDRFPSPFSS